MLPALRSLTYLAIAAINLVISCPPAYAQERDVLQVLVLNSFEENTEPYAVPKDVFMREMLKEHTPLTAFRQFDLHQHFKNEPGSEALKVQLLRSEYTNVPPDLVVAAGPPATAFWLKYRGPDLANVPFIGAGAEIALTGMDFRPGDAAVVTAFSFSDAIDNILHLLPNTSHVVMVFGSSPHELGLVSAAKEELGNTHAQMNFEYTNHMKLTALQNKLAGLLPGSVVFYGIFDRDADGVLLTNESGLSLVRANSSVPVFGAFDNHLGMGILGGRLIQLEQMGREIATIAQEVLHNRSSDITWKRLGMEVPTYDWRELQAWGIDPDQLPVGSTIRFMPPSVWEKYSGWILLTMLVVAAQVLLIASLLVQNRRRRQAELASRELGSRLISAHEDERRYLARELHDDLSQRLARVAIDASFVASKQGSDVANEVLQNLHPELISISKDVHDMSYRLHPALIRDLGLVAALQTECERLRRYTDASILERYADIRGQIPPDAALCVYRIAQEAISNTVKHANADTIEVMLEQRESTLILTVSDNGSGFSIVPGLEQSSLGLASMRERAQLAGGFWEIHSRPGEGTVVTAKVPLMEAVK